MSVAPVEAVGPYRLESLLGRGGMGEVYKAHDRRLDRSVAIKHIRPEDAGDPEARERFQREARTAAQLGHPAIAQVFDILEENGDAWIVMELIDGPTLAELVRDGPLDIGLVLSYGRQVASALAVAHAQGIVHRDLKSE
ncbi:MAG: serine/threonine protein kinase, partial [bacterium]|nr:serine/threonine protein kinase [bacterium]